MQLLRTYPTPTSSTRSRRRASAASPAAISKAVPRAKRLIYLEDQYLWSKQVAELFAQRLTENPELHLIAVVPRHPDVDGRLALPPNQVGRQQAIEACRSASPERVHVFDVENHEGTPVYVHAKVCVIDDVWACVGSDNFNRRSWTHDSELSCAVLDDDGRVRARPSAYNSCVSTSTGPPTAARTTASSTATPSSRRSRRRPRPWRTGTPEAARAPGRRAGCGLIVPRTSGG